MKCIICNSDSQYFFSKTYTEKPYDSFMCEIGKVNYYKCINCGFTMSKTHYDLDKEKWEKLNLDYHTYGEKAKATRTNKGNPPPYFEQAFMLNVLLKNNIISNDSILDFAGGIGTLSKILNKYFNIKLPIYDPYINEENEQTYISKENLKTYNTVINSALFEHVTSRNDLNEIQKLVSEDGCLIIHTVIAENVPKDENWFYISIPVHCSFHTNKSMELLMNQWGYKSSLYCTFSKCWVLFKKPPSGIERTIDLINREFQTDYLIYKKGFVDYWKGF